MQNRKRIESHRRFFMSKTERKMPEAARPGSLLRGFNPSYVFLCLKEVEWQGIILHEKN